MSHSLMKQAMTPAVGPDNDLGINLKKPKFPQYATVSRRLESFKFWPQYLPVSPQDLADAGLVYTGSGDSVRCYSCGGGIRNWEEGDLPWVEHAKWYPACPHVILVKGREFMQHVAENGTANVEDEASFQTEADRAEEPDLMVSIPALSCLEMGCKAKHVERAINSYTKQHGDSNFMARDLMEFVLAFEEEETETGVHGADPTTTTAAAVVVQRPTTESQTPTTDTDIANEDSVSAEEELQLRRENEQLKERQTCKICLDAKADVIFLPCGHMVSCAQCAPALVKCPICRVRVKGTVKTYLAGFT